ncbi:unnamed protein product [Brugia pahangi]|uniref:Ovule protein n=1 Tax=Brugia pahangi TaxID=6280 RepID=A0A0N4TCN4_BRUPA|nr:unnamed protein product [Brugia pahangi]
MLSIKLVQVCRQLGQRRPVIISLGSVEAQDFLDISWIDIGILSLRLYLILSLLVSTVSVGVQLLDNLIFSILSLSLN